MIRKNSIINKKIRKLELGSYQKDIISFWVIIEIIVSIVVIGV